MEKSATSAWDSARTVLVPLLVFLLPAAGFFKNTLLTQNSPVDLTLLIAALLTLAIAREIPRLLSHPVTVFFALFCCWAASRTGGDPEALRKVAVTGSLGGLALLSGLYIAEKPRQLRYLVFFLVLFSSAFAVSVLVQESLFQRKGYTFFSVLSSGYQGTGRLIATGTLALLVYLLWSGPLRRWMLLGGLALVALNLLGLARSGNISGYCGFLVCMLVLLGVRLKTPPKLSESHRHWVLGIVPLVLLFEIGVSQLRGGSHPVLGRAANQFESEILMADSLRRKDRPSRWMMWRDAFGKWTEAPVIGVGIRKWSDNPNALATAYPHNRVLEILAELGLVGLILYLSPIVLALQSTFTLKPATLATSDWIFPFAILSLYSLVAMFNLGFSDRWLLMAVGLAASPRLCFGLQRASAPSKARSLAQ